MALHSQQDEVDWLWSLKVWEEKYGYMLKEKTIGVKTRNKWWYTHGNLRRGWRLLTKDTEPFFQHVSRQLLPHSNNSLEGTFSQAVGKLHVKFHHFANSEAWVAHEISPAF